MSEPDLSFDNIRDKLSLRLVETKRNREYLRDKPYLDVGNGLALICDLQLSRNMSECWFILQINYTFSIDNSKKAVGYCCKDGEIIMAEHQMIDAMWDDSPVDVSEETSMIWSIANKLRGPYQSDKYKDVIIPMTIIRRFECALEPTKEKVVEQYEKNPNYPAKAMYRISGFQFYNTSRFTLAELCNDPDHLADNFVSYIQGFSSNVQGILLSEAKGLDFKKQITKMDKNNRLLSVVKAFSELDLNPRTIDNVKMGYIFEDLIRRFSENAEAGDHYTGRDIIKLMVNILLAEGCDDIFDDGKVITILEINTQRLIRFNGVTAA